MPRAVSGSAIPEFAVARQNHPAHKREKADFYRTFFQSAERMYGPQSRWCPQTQVEAERFGSSAVDVLHVAANGPNPPAWPPFPWAGGWRYCCVLVYGNESILLIRKAMTMARTGAVTFKGNPLTLAGEAVQVGKPAPDFTLHAFEGGALKAIKPGDLKGKPTILSVVPSLDTPVCQVQTKKFNEQLGAWGEKINALTVSLDLPFAMNRFCGAENIKTIRSASDYMDRSFGNNWGMLIEELKILARGTFVLDKDGTVVYAEQVKEVAEEPNYQASLAALGKLVG